MVKHFLAHEISFLTICISLITYASVFKSGIRFLLSPFKNIEKKKSEGNYNASAKVKD